MRTSLAAASAFVDLGLRDSAFKASLKNLQNLAAPAMKAVERIGAALANVGSFVLDVKDGKAQESLKRIRGQGKQAEKAVQGIGAAFSKVGGFEFRFRDTGIREMLKDLHARIKPVMIAIEQLGSGLVKLGGMGAGIGGLASASIFSFVDKFSPATMERFYFALNDISGVLGEMFAPAIETATGYLRQFADWLVNLDPETKEWIVLLGGAAVAIGVLGAAVLAVGTVLVGFTTVGAAAFSILGAIGSEAFLVAGAVTALAAAFGVLLQKGGVLPSWEAILDRLKKTAAGIKKELLGDLDGKMFPKGDKDKNRSSFGMGNWMQPKFVGIEDLGKQVQLQALSQGDIPTRQLTEAEKQNAQLAEMLKIMQQNAMEGAGLGILKP